MAWNKAIGIGAELKRQEVEKAWRRSTVGWGKPGAGRCPHQKRRRGQNPGRVVRRRDHPDRRARYPLRANSSFEISPSLAQAFFGSQRSSRGASTSSPELKGRPSVGWGVLRIAFDRLWKGSRVRNGRGAEAFEVATLFGAQWTAKGEAWRPARAKSGRGVVLVFFGALRWLDFRRLVLEVWRGISTAHDLRMILIERKPWSAEGSSGPWRETKEPRRTLRSVARAREIAKRFG